MCIVSHLGLIYFVCCCLAALDLAVLPKGCSVKPECRAADATQHLMLLPVTHPSALSSCYVTEGLHMLSIVQLTSTKLSVMCAQTCHFRPQEMWESMGVKWEWTWYSQTVHAYTEPDLVGANAGSVGLSSLHCFHAAYNISFACACAQHWASTAAVLYSAFCMCTKYWMHASCHCCP